MSICIHVAKASLAGSQGPVKEVDLLYIYHETASYVNVSTGILPLKCCVIFLILSVQGLRFVVWDSALNLRVKL